MWVLMMVLRFRLGSHNYTGLAGSRVHEEQCSTRLLFVCHQMAMVHLLHNYLTPFTCSGAHPRARQNLYANPKRRAVKMLCKIIVTWCRLFIRLSLTFAKSAGRN